MNKRILAALGTVILGAGVIAGIGTYVAAAKNDSGSIMATSAGSFTAPDGKTYPHYTLTMNTYPNSTFGGHHGEDGGAHPDWVSYGAAGPYGEPLRDAKTGTNFVVPAHSAVTITIWQYDSGETLNNDFFAKVRGTVGGTATLVERYDTSHTQMQLRQRQLPRFLMMQLDTHLQSTVFQVIKTHSSSMCRYFLQMMMK